MALRPQGIMGDIGTWVSRRKRPDIDESGILKASTELYYSDAATSIQPQQYRKENRVVLELKNVTRDFGGITAVKDLDFKLYEREILSIIGPNGAGKTTLFNLISGIYSPSTGEIIYEGRNIAGLKPHQVARAGIARTFQNVRLFNKMTVTDNVKVGRFCRTKSGPLSILLHLPLFQREEKDVENRAKEILNLFGARLTGYRFDQQALSLSYANRRRLEIARALSTEARVLLLDEPSAGMNPQETKEITEFIRKLRNQYGYTIILIEHKLKVVRTVSDRVLALDYGIKIAEGRYEDVSHNESVIEAYLGKKR